MKTQQPIETTSHTTAQAEQLECNYTNNYYGDQVCVLKRKEA
jgi:hypothetical protein